jgi:hypothetical protein
MTVKVTLSLPVQLWQAFRLACREHKTPASRVIARLITAQLDAWQREPRDEAWIRDHYQTALLGYQQWQHAREIQEE